MNNDSAFLICFVATFVSLLLEILCSVAWFPAYFRFGIPIFKARARFTPGDAGNLRVTRLEAQFEGTFIPSLAFKKLGTNEWAFRNSIGFRVIRTGLMRGHIRIDRNNGNVCE